MLVEIGMCLRTITLNFIARRTLELLRLLCLYMGYTSRCTFQLLESYDKVCFSVREQRTEKDTWGLWWIWRLV